MTSVSLLLLMLPLAVTAQVYERVDEHGGRSFSDQPQSVSEARTHAEEVQRQQARSRRGISPRAVTAEQRERLTQAYKDAEMYLAALEKQKLATCGQQPRGGFAGGGPKRDRYLAYDRCDKNFEQALNAARADLEIAYRNYLSMK